MMRWRVFVVLASSTVASAAQASPSARLTYVRGEGAASCPDEEALRKAVAARLGFDPFFPAANKSVVAEVARTDKGYRGRVVILDAAGVLKGERSFPPTSQDCAETVRALALAISIALDDPSPDPVPPPAPEERPPETPSTAPTAASTPPEPRLTPPPTPTPNVAPLPDPPASSSPFELRVGAGPHIALGLSPSPTVGAQIGAALVLTQRFSLSLEGRLDAPSSESIPGAPGRVVTQYAGGKALACVHAKAPFACLSFGAGSFSGRGEGVTEPRASAALLFTAGARVGVDVPLSDSFALQPFADLEVPLARHEVQISGITRFRLPILAGSLGASLALRFR